MVVHKAHSIPIAKPDPKTTEQFRRIPWCAEIYDNPEIRPALTLTRMRSAPGANRLIGKTLATDETIGAWQSFWEPPSSRAPLGQLVAIVGVAEGLSGHAKTLHGGMISLLLDESMNYIGAAHLTPGMAAFTASINMKFRKPLPIPSIIMIRAWVEEKSSGRKLFIRGNVEDGQGGVFAEGESMFIEVEKPKL